MALKRRLSYHWRLFIPIVTILWLLIGAMLLFQFRRERASRSEIIRTQLSFINNRIIAAYESGVDREPFMRYVAEYFGNDLYHDILVSVYNLEDGTLEAHIGTPLPMENAPAKAIGVGKDAAHLDASLSEAAAHPDMFYYSVETSKDGNLRAITAMPYSVTISDALGAEPEMWVISFVLAILATLVAYISTHYLSRSIRLLHEFTNYTATADDAEFITKANIPADELGDITRQIIDIYNKRAQALRDLDYEHRMAQKATKEKGRLKRELTNNINHELKTPIGIIKGYIDTMVENPGMSDAQRESFLKKAQANADRLCTLLNDMSTITRLEQGNDNIPTEPVDFHELIYNIADEICEAGMLGSMTFRYKLPFECVVRGNLSLLNGMILNLVKNAVNYSKGTEICLEMVAENSDFYTFSFYDNGVGVDDEHIPYLFDRFYRIDTGRSRKVGGTGLGLPIVKSTIVSLGGTIVVKNHSGGGLEFVFTLPKVATKA